jgi:chromosomal replication initiation ATPase DnaA
MHTEPALIAPPMSFAGASPASSSIFEHVLKLVSKEKRVPVRLILNASRCRLPAARARQLAMYLAHVVHGQSLTSIAEVFQRDRTTVSYACGVIEDLRDDPAFDAEVTRLEELLQDGESGHV